MKRLLVFAGYYHPHVGGYEKYLAEVIDNLLQKGYQVDVLTTRTDSAPTREYLGKLRIFRLPCWNILRGAYPVPRPSFMGLVILFTVLFNHYDYVNTQTRFFLTSLYGLIFTAIKRTPLVHTEHGSRHSLVQNKVVDLISKAYDHTVGSLLVRSARTNIGISRAAGEFLKHLGALKIQIIPNGIDTDFYDSVDTDLKQKLDLNGKIVLTFVGRLIYSKGIQDLITVLPDIKNNHPEVVLLVVGDGPYLDKLISMIKHYDCANHVRLLGQKSPSEIVEILSVTDIFINPSYSEGLPTSVLEASSMSLPIIATNVGGTEEIVLDNNTGLLIHPGNTSQLASKIERLILDKDLRVSLGKNARTRVSQYYSWSQIIERLERVFNVH